MHALPRMLLAALWCGLAALPSHAGLVTVYSSGQLALGESRGLTAYVQLAVPTVTWTVNGVPGGNATWGTINAAGLYQAPATMPMANAVTVVATSTSRPSESGSATLTITQPLVHLWSSRPAKLAVGAFTLDLNGGNFTPGVTARLDGVALSTSVISATQLRVSGVVLASQAGRSLPLTVAQSGIGATTSETVRVPVTTTGTNPPPTPDPTPSPTPTPPPTPNPGPGLGTPDLAASRLLEQAAFGPSPAALARVKLLGANAWLNEQLTMPETAITIPADGSNATVQAQLLARLANAPDQLRQRVAHALYGFIPISINKNNYPAEIVPHLQLLSRNAFGNYRTLLGELSTSAQMGKYLDLANSNKPNAGSSANENYARELLQLFTIGLVQLNPDGSSALDATGAPRPTYDQATVQQVALAFTGWTYAGAGNNNWENFSGPLQARDVNHDLRAKAFLGCSLPAGQGTQQDMTATLDCIFRHPNVAPFVVTRLIRNLVTSNPTPGYVQRVSAVFDNNGAGVRGDLRATVRAILLDSEARNDVAGPDSGRLKDPFFHVLSVVRALGGTVSPANQQAWSFSRLGETPLMPASVFGHWSPLFRAPKLALFGPEFQIYTPTEAVLRGNFLWQLLSSPGTDFPLDLSRFINLGGNTTALIDAVDQTLLYGRMPQAMRQALANAVAVQYDNRARALTALYLTMLSGQHAIQY
jgi:uncharacterized protein (DUF1800 family)